MLANRFGCPGRNLQIETGGRPDLRERFSARTLAFSIAILAVVPMQSLAQQLEVPFNTYCPPDSEAACFGAATVMGLDPDGDGFLAVRTGPGSDFPMIAKLHNGDRIGTYGRSGKWYAISFGPDNRLGWAHGNWLGNHIP